MQRFDYRERADGWAVLDVPNMTWVKLYLSEDEARSLAAVWNEVAEYLQSN